MPAAKKTSRPGLYANIHAKQERMAHGSGEKMRKPGSPGAPSDAASEAAAAEKTGKKGVKRAPTKKSAGKAAKKR